MKKEIFKVITFFAGLMVLQALIGYLTQPREIKNFRKYLASGVDCIYFCDSVMNFYTIYDESSESVLALIKKKNVKFSIEAVEHPGYNMDIYYSYFNAAVESEKKPKVMIIPISLYSLSAEWLRPGYKFELEQEALRSSSVFNLVFYRVIASLKKETMTMQQYLNTPVYKGKTLAGKIADFEGSTYKVYTDNNFRKKIISRYMYAADLKNGKIQSLQRIAGMIKNSGIRVVFYIAPVDYETCTAFYGPEFQKNIDRNIAYISELLKDSGGLFLDFSKLLGKKSFAWDETFYVNEHLNYIGRATLAAELAAEINKLF